MLIGCWCCWPAPPSILQRETSRANAKTVQTALRKVIGTVGYSLPPLVSEQLLCSGAGSLLGLGLSTGLVDPDELAATIGALRYAENDGK